MENGYQIISSKEEYDTLVKKLASEMIKIPERTSVFQDAPKSSGRKDLLPFIEHIDYCYYRSIILLIKSIKASKKHSDDVLDVATKLCKDLLFCESFKEYLLISSLYTTRYLLCDSFMRLDSYVYYSTHLEENESFLQSDILNRHTEKEHISRLTVHSPIHSTFKINDEKEDKKHTIEYNQDYTDAINQLANKGNKSHYKYLFDYRTVPMTNGSGYVIPLFMPEFTLLFVKMIKKKDNGKLSYPRKIKHSGITIPEDIFTDQNDIESDDLETTANSKNKNTEKSTSQRFRDSIFKSLKYIDEDFMYLKDKMKQDKYYSDDAVKQMLFMYRLNRTFPLDYLSTIFSTDNLDHLDPALITVFNRIPDIKLRCRLYNSYRQIPVALLKIVIDTVFPLLEKTFFTLLAGKCSFEALDQHLDKYFKLPLGSVTTHTLSHEKNTTSLAKSITNNITLIYEHSKDVCDEKIKYLSKKTKTKYKNRTTLEALLLFFIGQFNYTDDEDIFKAYDYLLGQNAAKRNIQTNSTTLFSIYSKRDLLNYISEHISIPEEQTDMDIPSPFIYNRKQLLKKIAEILNVIIDS